MQTMSHMLQSFTIIIGIRELVTSGLADDTDSLKRPLERGVGIVTVKELLGWKSGRMRRS